MHVCYLLKRFPRLSQTFVFNELLELQRQDVQLTVVALRDGGDEPVDAQLAALTAPVYYLAPPSATGGWMLRSDHAGAVDLGATVDWTGDDPETAQAAAIALLIRRLGVDHLHAHFATWAARVARLVGGMTGVPYSFTAHAHDIYHASVDRRALAGTIAQAQFVITVSEYNKRYLQALLSAHSRTGHVIRLYNGIDVQRFTPGNGLKEPDLIVGVGRLVPKKGFGDLIEACRLLQERGRPFQCVIVGDGPERAALAQQIANAGLDHAVTLVGAQPHAEVIELIRRATVFVLPCVVGGDGDRDGLPTVLLEAMALGTPVISTRVSGIPELIEHEQNGLLIDEGDAGGLAGAIERLLGSEALRQALSAAALQTVRRRFDLARNVATLRHFFTTASVPA